MGSEGRGMRIRWLVESHVWQERPDVGHTGILCFVECMDPSLESVLPGKTDSALRMTSGWVG